MASQIALRDYQIEAANRIRQAFKERNKAVLMVLPCGAGKTVLFAYIAEKAQEKGKSVLFLVHRIELLEQTIATFENFGIELKNIEIGTVINTANQLEKRTAARDYELIIFDEAHHSTSKTWRRIIDCCPNSKIVGLTATPCRLDGSSLGNIYDKMIVGISAENLITQKYLAGYRYFAPTVEDLSSAKIRGKEYDMQDVEVLLDKPAIFGQVVDNFKKLAGDYQTICYCPTIAYSKQVADKFVNAGFNAVHFDGTTNKAERAKIIQDFRDKKIQILCNVDLISEGFDVPDCWCCILLRPTKSTALFIQQATRALRPAPYKTAIIIDHVANYLRHGFPTMDREWSLEKSLKEYQPINERGELHVRQCLECFGTFKTAPKCPYCGAEYKLTEKEIKEIQNIACKEIERREIEKHLERKEKYKQGNLVRIKTYTSYTQCKSRYDLKLYCELHKIPHKQFIAMCYKMKFLR